MREGTTDADESDSPRTNSADNANVADSSSGTDPAPIPAGRFSRFLFNVITTLRAGECTKTDWIIIALAIVCAVVIFGAPLFQEFGSAHSNNDHIEGGRDLPGPPR